MVWVLNALMAIIGLSWWVAGQQFLLRDDSGIFVYIGQQMAAGKRLYIDVWDHKPPLLYWWNALGCSLTPGGLMGVWAMAVLNLSAGVNLFYAALRSKTSSSVAGLGASLLASGLLGQLEQPNFTEVYALPWQAVLFWLGLRAWDGKVSARSGAFAGIATVLLVGTRPNNAAAGLWFLAALVFGQVAASGKIRSLGGWMLGVGAAGAATVFPFLLQASLADMLYASFGFNFTYAQQKSLTQQGAAMLNGCLQLTHSGVLPLTLAGAWLLWDNERRLAAALGVWFFLEMMLATLSGRAYSHYFAVPLMAAASLAAFGAGTLADRRLAGRLALSLALLCGLQAAWQMRARAAEAPDRETASFRRIRDFVGPAESFYYWGEGPRHLWYDLHRPAPAALFHTTPVLANAGQYRALAPALLAGLAANPPYSLIENLASPTSLEAGGWDTAETASLKRRLMARYDLVSEQGEERFWRRR
jgi:hypothetical protein